MAECSSCGISGEKARLYDVITSEGLAKLCENCSRQGNFPVIRKPTDLQLKEAERRPSIQERLSGMAGIKFNPAERDKQANEKFFVPLKQDTSLREIVDRNYRENAKPAARPRPDLVDNFHWALMRARRSKKLTQKQLAEAIGEPEAAVKMAEEGFLPEDGDRLLNKIQGYLGINLSKEKKPQTPSPAVETIIPEEIEFDRETAKGLKISDLKKIFMRKKKDKDLSEEEIRKIIFKK